jgi:hypothetical protein
MVEKMHERWICNDLTMNMDLDRSKYRVERILKWFRRGRSEETIGRMDQVAGLSPP